MNILVEKYLKENIDSNVDIKEWNKKKLPIYLREIYDFHEVNLLTSEFLMATFIYRIPSIREILKHKKVMEEYSDKPVVFHHKDISTYRRKEYLQKGIPFVVANGQVYLPFMSLDINQQTKTYTEEYIRGKNKFNATEQIAFLMFLYDKNVRINATEFSKRYEISNMTASRALNELYNKGLLTYSIGGKTNRSKCYSRIADPDYFNFGSSYLGNPVKKTVYSFDVPAESEIAGFEALANLSSINPPKTPVRAVYRQKIEGIKLISDFDREEEEKKVEIQLWSYDPGLFSKGNLVDLASLYLSLKDVNDERINQALEELLRKKSWYSD